MPELPDIDVYIDALEERLVGHTIENVRLKSPFLIRSYDPPLRSIVGKKVTGFRRIGKRIVWELEDELFVVLHLMVAGRLKYGDRGMAVPRRLGLIAFDFEHASLLLTEASKKKRASIHVVRSEEALAELDPGGIDVMRCTLDEFATELRRENHTVKRTMTDPHVFSGIGNAYSDEILHRAKLSPVRWTSRLSDEQISTLFEATREVLTEWLERLRKERGSSFPLKVTAFRKEMAVHGKFKDPCPVCNTAVQRIVRGASEVNYCPTCQTDGKLLADRALSRLLRGDWPKTLEALEERKVAARVAGSTDPPVGKATAKPATSKAAAATKATAKKATAKKATAKKATAKKATAKKATAKKAAQAAPRIVTSAAPRHLLLFAHGAGASSGSTWMAEWATRLQDVGRVVRFDYQYIREGRRRPDHHNKLVATHIDVLKTARARRKEKVVLIGKSMGGRMGCHVSLTEHVAGIVCLGYPLISASKTKKRRDAVLLELTTPVLFVQGTRDKLCPLDDLRRVQKQMTARNALHVVETGDHSLLCTKTWLKQNERSQADVDAEIAAVISQFVTGLD